VTLVDAILNLEHSWAKISSTVIANCFGKAAFIAESTSEVADTDQSANDGMPQWVNEILSRENME
jgi:hypothetical protein